MHLKIVLFFSFLVCSLSANASSCQPEAVSYAANSKPFEVSQYLPENPGQKSLLIIPPTGGTNLIDRSYAKTFCKSGFDVFLVNDWPRQGEDTPVLEVHEKFYSNAQVAIQAVVDKIQTPFIGILGTSVGALHGSISITTMKRLNAAFLIVGGLPIAEVVVTSDQQAMRELRSVRQKMYHFKSDEENIQAIEKVFSLEPMKQGELYKAKDIGAVISSEDHTVPYPTHQKLRDFFKPKKVIALKNDHFWAIVKTWLFHTDEVVSFFESSYQGVRTAKTSKAGAG